MTLNKKHCLIFLTIFLVLILGTAVVSATTDTNNTQEVTDNKELSTPTNNDVDKMVQTSVSKPNTEANVETTTNDKTDTNEKTNTTKVDTTKTIIKKDMSISTKGLDVYTFEEIEQYNQENIYDDVVLGFHIIDSTGQRLSINGIIEIDYNTGSSTYDPSRFHTVPVVNGFGLVDISYQEIYKNQNPDPSYSYSWGTVWLQFISEDETITETDSLQLTAATVSNYAITGSVNPTSAQLGESFTITGTLKRGNNLMGGYTVYLSVDGEEVDSGITDNNGQVIFTDTPSTLGNHTAILTVKQKNGIKSAKSTNDIKYRVDGDPSYISIYANETVVTGAQPVKVYGVLTNSSGNPIGGATVNLTFKNQYKATTTTDPETGEYSFDYTTDVADNTADNIKVLYGGDDEKGINATSNATTLKVNPFNTNITFTASNTQYGGETNVTGYVYDILTGDVIQSGQVLITITNGGTNTPANIVDGKFEYLRSMTNIGQKTVTVTFQASGLYSGSVNTTTFTVTKGITNMTINTNGPIKVGQSLTVSGDLLNDFGNNLGSRQYVNVTVGTETKHVQTPRNTFSPYTATFSITEPGDYDIIVEFEGTTNYLASKNTTVFSVYKIPTITNVSVVNDLKDNVTIDVSVYENDTKFKDNITSGQINVTVGDKSKLYDITGKTTRITLDGDVNITTTDPVEFKVEFVESTVDLNSTGINSTTGETITMFTARPVSSRITVNVTPIIQNITSNVTISGEVFDEFGNIVEEGNVTIDINTSDEPILVPFTGGRYEHNLTTLVAGNNSFNVTFNASKTESGSILISESKNSSSFMVDKLPTITNVITLNNSYNNVTIRVNVTTTSDEENLVSTGLIYVYDFIHSRLLEQGVNVGGRIVDLTLPLEPGTNKLLVYYQENNIYLESNFRNESAFTFDKDVFVVNVERIPSITQVGDVLSNKSGEFRLRINVTNTTGDYISSGHVIIFDADSGELLGEGDLDNGNVDIDLPGLTEPGNVRINVTYEGNEYYLPSNALGNTPGLENTTTLTVTVDPKITISMSSNETRIGQAITVYSYVYNETGEMVSDANVIFTIDNHDYKAEYDTETGIYSYVYTPTSNGTFTVNASYNRDDIKVATSENLELIVYKINSTTKVETVNTTAGNVTLEISVEGDDGNTSMKGELKIVIDGFYPVNVDYNGESIIVPLHGNITRSGLVNVEVIFMENDAYYNSTDNTRISVKNQVPLLELTVEKETIELGDKAVIIGNLSDDLGNKLADSYIEISINDVLVATVKTDENGTFTYEYATNKTGENIPVTAYYAGDNTRYGPTSNDTFFNVIQNSDYELKVEASNITYGEAETITVTLPDDAKGFVTVNVTGRSSETISLEEGNVLIIPAYSLNAGDYEVNISYTDTNYALKTNKTTFNVDKAASGVSVSAENITVGYPETIKVTLPEYAHATGNISVMVTKEEEIISEEVIKVSDLSEGTKTITLTDLTDGTYTVNVVFTNDTNYIDSSSRTEFTVSLPEIKLFQNDSIFVDESVLIHGTVTDVNNNPLTGKIILSINNEETELLVDDYVKGINKLFNKNGTYTINATYKLGDKKIVTSNNIVITVDKIPTGTTLDVIESTPGNVVVKVKVMGNDELITTGSVTVVDNSTGEVLGEGSLENGQVEITLDTIIPGALSIKAVFPESDRYLPSNSSVETINVEKLDAKVTINIVDDDVFIGDTVVIYGTVTDTDDKVIKEGTVTVNINGIEYPAEIRDGEYRLNNITSIAGEFTVNATFNDNGRVKNSTSSNKQFTVNKIPTQTSITVKDIHVGSTSLDVIVVDQNKDSVTTGTLRVTTPTGTVTVPVTSETTNIPITTTESGNISVTIEYQENTKYENSTEKTIITVTKLDTTTFISVTTPVKVTEEANISGVLLDETNKPVSGAKVEIKVDNKAYTNTRTDNDGKYALSISQSVVGTHNVSAEYAGDNKYFGSSAAASYTIEKLQSSITINPTKTVTVGENVEVSGKLLDVNNKPVSGATVQVNYDGNIKNTTTDKDGNYKTSYPTKSTGEKTITATFIGNDKYDASQTTATSTVDKNNATISVTLPDNAKVGQPTSIKGKITDKDGKAVANMPVTVTVNGEPVKTITDNNGNFQVTGINPVEGNNLVTVSSGDDNYNIKDVTDKFTAKKPEAKVTLDTIKDTFVANTVKVTGKLVDEQNNPITNVPVKVTVNNDTSTVVTGANGNYEIMTSNTLEGTNNVTVKYEDTKYNSNTAKTTFKAKKSKVKLTVLSINGTLGEDITLTARLTDELGNPVSGGNLVFKMNGKTLRTDGRFNSNSTPYKFKVENGIVTYTMKADQFIRDGKNLTASYSGSYRYEETKANVASVNIRKRTASVTVTVTPKKTRQNNDIVFTATLKDVTKDATNKTCLTENANLIFKLNGITMKNSQGKADRIPVTSSVINYVYHVATGMGGFDSNGLKNYTVEAVYDNPVFYPDTRNSSVFHVERSEVKINFTKTTLKNNVLSIKATFKDFDNKYLVGTSKVCVKINGKTYQVNGKTKYFQVKDGKVDLTGIKVAKGTTVKEVMLVTGAREGYLGARASTTDISS